ncbi:THAP domain-containing protein 11 [Bienertia sinuspersici]
MISHTCSASTKTFPLFKQSKYKAQPEESISKDALTGLTPVVSSNGQMRKIGDTRIAELEILIKEFENDVKKLKETNWKLEDDVAEMAIENTEQLTIIRSATADKKLYNLFVASWILFAIVLLLLGRGG